MGWSDDGGWATQTEGRTAVAGDNLVALGPDVWDPRGNVLCTVPLDADRQRVVGVRRDPDGSILVTIATTTASGEDEPYIDRNCITGEDQPSLLAPPFSGEDSETFIEWVVGGRRFDAVLDAEGNTSSILADNGLNLVGGDYAGETAFSADGTWLAYTEHSLPGTLSHWWSPNVRVRNTTTGEAVTTYQAAGVVCSLAVTNDGRLVLAVAPPEFNGDGECVSSSLSVVELGQKWAAFTVPFTAYELVLVE